MTSKRRCGPGGPGGVRCRGARATKEEAGFFGEYPSLFPGCVVASTRLEKIHRLDMLKYNISSVMRIVKDP